MSVFEYEYSNRDRQLVVGQEDNFNFGENSTDYIRLTIYPTEGLENIVALPGTGEQAIFYASFEDSINFSINTAAFNQNLEVLENNIKLIGAWPTYSNDFKIYRNPVDDNIYIKPNEIFNQFELPKGEYKIQIDFLNQVNSLSSETTNITPDYLKDLPFPHYFQEFDIDNHQGQGPDMEGLAHGDTIGSRDATKWLDRGRPDIVRFIVAILTRSHSYITQPDHNNQIYEYTADQISYLTSLIDAYSDAVSNNTTTDMIDLFTPIGENSPQPFSNFFNPTLADLDYVPDKYFYFVIKQISTSRKEVRLKLVNRNITNNSQIETDVKGLFNGTFNEFTYDGITPNPNYRYQFKHLLNIGDGDHIPIMNYHFDPITDGKDNQSLILKLYNQLPTTISNLSLVTIEKEVLTTQVQNIYYFSDVPDVYFGDGLYPDTNTNWINPDGNEIGFQNYNQLTSSLGDIAVDSIISQSEFHYPNLNTDYRFFSNHTFFGSAKKKLENFKTKVGTIQGYYTEISKSLSISCSIDSDSEYTIETRKDLFKKINKEIRTFTPYERFLYYDGQGESTASAPSVGKNYADTIPVQTDFPNWQNDYVGQIDGGDGFDDAVYHHSSENMGGINQYISLFTEKYHVHNKPFFNYSSSIYLSFLMKADSGSSLSWGSENQNPDANGLGVPLPKKAHYQQTLLAPNMTSSAYQRYIFHTSQSYWVPELPGEITLLNTSDFTNGTNIKILSGSTKTGSWGISDHSGKYPVTAKSQSNGIPFYGSVMPAGELFRIAYQNTLSQSLEGYLNFDSQTSGSDVTDNMMLTASIHASGTLDDPGPLAGTHKKIKVTDGVEVHGRKYGKSVLFTSESRHELDLDDTKFNFGRDDNFSLAIWAKRFHPNTGSADSGRHGANGGGGSGSCNLIGRGSTAISYGITYNEINNRVSAGVRGPTPIGGAGSTQEIVTFDTTDDLLNWHHFVFTYRSGSSTGLNLYVDGKLEDTDTTLAPGFSITGSYNFTASNYAGEPLAVGGNELVGGNNVFFSGFLQYPRVYDKVLTNTEVKQLYLTPDGHTDSKITDVKVTLNNPSNSLPFDVMYKTGSTEWTDWYNGMHDSASAFDTDNIHSFENNLPLYIQESSEYKDMKDFLNLQGEQYDLIRNHIDSMGTLHDRGYKKTNSPPENTYPILLDNMGWEAINPFSGSLSDSLGKYLTGVTTIDDIKNNTWRKTLNNLIYIYKTKGTKNSVRALLNTYGYPPDVINFQEFHNSTEDVTNTILLDNAPDNDKDTIDLVLDSHTGSFGFESRHERLFRWMFNGKEDRILNLDWWMDSANINTFEFLYKHKKTSQTQTILESSGSGNETLWDLRLLPSSDGASSSFQFRLNNSQKADTAIGSRGYSMSLAYDKMLPGELWNVMVQRMTSSISGTGTNEYRLHASLQQESTIKKYNYVTMSISGGYTGDSSAGGLGFFANQNWQSSGSRHYLSSSNLFVGETFSGSLAEIRGWSTALSISRFRQHTLNKFSVTGNSINSHKNELAYHFKLNENYVSSSVSSSTQLMDIVDSAPRSTHNPNNYTFKKSGSFFSSSLVYGVDFITTYRYGTIDNNQENGNDNGIITNPDVYPVGDLNAWNPAVIKEPVGLNDTPGMAPSGKLEVYRSPQTYVNQLILNNMDTYNFELYYGNPQMMYSSSYTEFDTLRREFFEAHPIEVDTNKFIKAHENMFGHSIIEAVKRIVPARSTFSDRNANIGVMIKPTLLEKQKYENERHSIEVNPNTATGSINVLAIEEYITSASYTVIRKTDGIHLDESGYDSVKEGEVFKPTSASGSVEIPISQSISLGNSYQTSSIGGNANYRDNKYITPEFLQPGGYSASIVNPYTGSMSPTPTLTGSGVIYPKSGSIDYGSDANKSFVNIHDSWGRGANDTHFINFAGGTGSNNDYNVGHIETRNYFYAYGDCEIYSSSKGYSSDFSNQSRFGNRQILTEGLYSDITYESYMYNNPGSQTGVAMGKTRYFYTSSNGDITLPRNHVSKFNNPFRERMVEGTQNINPGRLPVQQEDYSTASFYRVKVTGGSNRLKIIKDTPSIDSSGNIM